MKTDTKTDAEKQLSIVMAYRDIKRDEVLNAHTELINAKASVMDAEKAVSDAHSAWQIACCRATDAEIVANLA